MRWTHDDGGRATAGYKGETGDCACRSIAIATGKPYQQVYDALNALGAKERTGKHKRGTSNARTGVYPAAVRRYMASIGWRWVPTMQIGSGTKVHLRDGELPMGRLVVVVSKHYTAIIDGVVHDNHDPSRNGTRAVYGYFTPAHRAAPVGPPTATTTTAPPAKPTDITAAPAPAELATVRLKDVRLEEVKLDCIVVGDRVDQTLSEDAVSELMESMAKDGLVVPIMVTRPRAQPVLIYGAHRLEAARRLGWSTILCLVMPKIDDFESKKYEIIENLFRRNTTPARRAHYTAILKVIYENEHPEAKSVRVRGGPGRGNKAEENQSQVGTGFEGDEPTPAFIDDTSKKTGRGRTTVARDNQRASEIPHIEGVFDTSLDKGDELDALGKLSKDRQAELIERAKEGERVSAKTELKKQKRTASKPAKEAPRIRQMPAGLRRVVEAWESYGEDAHQSFLIEIAERLKDEDTIWTVLDALLDHGDVLHVAELLAPALSRRGEPTFAAEVAHAMLAYERHDKDDIVRWVLDDCDADKVAEVIVGAIDRKVARQAAALITQKADEADARYRRVRLPPAAEADAAT